MPDTEHSALALVGGRIRKARETSGINLHELARLSGISAPALSRIETGKRDLRITSLYRIAAALRIQARDFLDEPPAEGATHDDRGAQGYDLTDYT